MATNSQVLVSLNYLARDSKFETEKPFTCFVDLSGVPQAETCNIVNVAIDDIPVTDSLNLSPFAEELSRRAGQSEEDKTTSWLILEYIELALNASQMKVLWVRIVLNH